MHVFISPDDDRRAGACAPLTPGGEATGKRRQTDSGDASNGEHLGGEIPHQRDFGRTHPTRDRFRMRRIAVR